MEKLHEGMPIRLTIGAIEEAKPSHPRAHCTKGVAEGGAIQFEIKAAVILEQGQFLRAGYSATADVVIDERKHVLAVSERLILSDGDQPFVDVLVGENIYERRDLKVGLSDGLVTEVLEGVEQTDALKIWNQPRYE